jgi:hypothetical protein
MSHQIVLYTGCALTYASEAYKEKVFELREILRRELGVLVLEFLGMSEGTPADVYQRDIEECVGGCDLLVALADGPSTGLGLEIGAALWKFQKPVLVLAEESAKVTRLILGLPDHFPGMVAVKRYQNMHADVPAVVRAHCSVLRLSQQVVASSLEQFSDPETSQLFRQKKVTERH